MFDSFSLQVSFVTAAEPFIADRHAVVTEGHLVPAPHLRGGMVLPAAAGYEKRAKQLENLDALLSESLPIQHAGGFGEVGVRKESLNSYFPPSNVLAYSLRRTFSMIASVSSFDNPKLVTIF